MQSGAAMAAFAWASGVSEMRRQQQEWDLAREVHWLRRAVWALALALVACAVALAM